MKSRHEGIEARRHVVKARRMHVIRATQFMLVAGLAGVAGLALSACHGDREGKPPHQFLPDMDDSPKWKPQAESEFFSDGRTMRPAAEGAVAYGHWAFDAKKHPSEPWGASGEVVWRGG